MLQAWIGDVDIKTGTWVSTGDGRLDPHQMLALRELVGVHLAKTGVDGARALQQSQLELLTLNIGGRRPYEHPFYWAGFVASQQ